MELNLTSNVWAAVVGGIGLLASVSTASLSYYLTKRSQAETEDRKLKEEFYRAFIKALNDVTADNSSSEAHERFGEVFNSMLLIASVRVVKAMFEFHAYLRVDSRENIPPRGSVEGFNRYCELLTKLIKELRRDLLADKSDIDELPQMYLIGKIPPITNRQPA